MSFVTWGVWLVKIVWSILTNGVELERQIPDENVMGLFTEKNYFYCISFLWKMYRMIIKYKFSFRWYLSRLRHLQTKRKIKHSSIWEILFSLTHLVWSGREYQPPSMRLQRWLHLQRRPNPVRPWPHQLQWCLQSHGLKRRHSQLLLFKSAQVWPYPPEHVLSWSTCFINLDLIIYFKYKIINNFVLANTLALVKRKLFVEAKVIHFCWCHINWQWLIVVNFKLIFALSFSLALFWVARVIFRIINRTATFLL